MSVILSRGDNRVGGVSSDAVLRREYAKRMTAPGQAVLRRHGAGQSLTAKVQALFENGEQGAWYDPSDFSTMFQDDAGTTPVTAVGQPVGRINDKSGRGNHATQATAGYRPLLLQDGGGNYYLAFDGVDDFLATASAIALNAAPLNSITGHFNNVTGVQRVWSNSRYRFGTSAAALVFTSTGAKDYATSPLLSATAPYVVSTQFDAEFDVVFRLNTSDIAPILHASDAVSGQSTLQIGRDAGIGQFLNGGIYPMILRKGSMTAGEIATCEAYVNSKTGAY